MIYSIEATDDRVMIVKQKLYQDITVSIEYGAFHNDEWGIVDKNLMRLVSVVNKFRIEAAKAASVKGE